MKKITISKCYNRKEELREAYSIIAEHGTEHDVYKFSRATGLPILEYDNVLYVVDHEEQIVGIAT